MCGFAGSFAYADGPAAFDALENQLRALRHRGPEPPGVWRGDRVRLGHQRLPIIDTSETGRQPIQNEDGTVVVVVNGEFYGAGSIRDRLRHRGHTFRGTGSDPFGPGCAVRPWDDGSNSIENAQNRLPSNGANQCPPGANSQSRMAD